MNSLVHSGLTPSIPTVDEAGASDLRTRWATAPVNMALEHYSKTAVRSVRSTRQNGERPDKPCGFWVSVPGDDDWPSWCRGEEWGAERLVQRHVLALSDTANLLLLDSVEALDAFDEEFSTPSYPESPTLSRFTSPDWRRVTSLWDGILIAPYQWERRISEKCRWYYGWDCASGCIWNARAVAAIAVTGNVDASAVGISALAEMNPNPPVNP